MANQKKLLVIGAHPDHRNTSILVQDCSYLVQVPNVCPLTPVLRYQPAIFYMPDNFQKPYPFTPDFVFDITEEFINKIKMYHQYDSQFYEWLPWVNNTLDTVPEGDEERFKWLSEKLGAMGKIFADNWRELLVLKYGKNGDNCIYAEALERCEYGGWLSDAQVQGIFPF